ncbi:hypothetical protein BASA61_006832 [Batrachochytrium salamandrivorans]|nr:hypothetical protein BASA61_006832 [Batrachochytrium salamandrivorans]
MSPLRERLLASTAASPLTSSERPSATSTTSLSSPYRGNSYISSQHQQPLLQHQRARLSRSLRSARSARSGQPVSDSEARQIFLLLLAILPEAMLEALLVPLYPFIVRHLLPDEPNIGRYVGLMGSSFYMPLFAMNLVWGGVSDRYGGKPVLIAGLVMCLITSVVMGFSQTYWLTIACRFAAGIFGANSTVAKGMLGEIARDDAGRSWAYAIYSSVYGVVGILGPILGGLLADPAKLYPGTFGNIALLRNFPFLLPCMLGAVPAVICLATTMVFVRGRHSGHAHSYDTVNISEDELDLYTNAAFDYSRRDPNTYTGSILMDDVGSVAVSSSADTPVRLARRKLSYTATSPDTTTGNESNRYSETDIDMGYSNHVAGDAIGDELTSITSLPLVRDVDSVASQLEDNATMGSERRPSPSPRNSLIPESATSTAIFPQRATHDCISRSHVASDSNSLNDANPDDMTDYSAERTSTMSLTPYSLFSLRTLGPILLYCTIALTNIMYVTSLPLYLSAPREVSLLAIITPQISNMTNQSMSAVSHPSSGVGAGLNSRDTSFYLMAISATKLLTQMVLFKHIKSYFVFRGESRGSFQAAMALYIPAHFAIPIASSMVAFIPSNASVPLVFTIAMCIIMSLFGIAEAVAYVSVIVLITESASGTGALGLAHGFASTMAACVRTLGPALVGILWEIGASFIAPGASVWVVFGGGAAVAFMGVIAAWAIR